MKYFLVTFGCAANVADSERISASYKARGFKEANKIEEADHVIINTCMVRESAENRVYGLVNNLEKLKSKSASRRTKLKIVVIGCMVGMAVRDKTGKMLKVLKDRIPQVDEFLPIEEVGFDYVPIRTDKRKALVPISNGCNNFCTFCIVPFTRGREISRPFEEIVAEVNHLAKSGYEEILLIGQNVNSYGADLKNKPNAKTTFVKHLGRYRIPTLFPYLLETLCQIDGIKKIDFISSNPWDFSDELISTIANNPKITRSIHLPVQSGDNEVLKRMNRWYTADDYLKLVEKLKLKIKKLKLSTDIIVGFPGETKKQFESTVDLCKKVGFYKAYLAIYSDRPLTAAHKAFQEDVPYKEKKRRWKVLEKLINKKVKLN